MKEKLIELIVACDKDLHDVATHETMCPSSSIEEIAEYVSENISNDFVAALMSKIMEQLKDYWDRSEINDKTGSC